LESFLGNWLCMSSENDEERPIAELLDVDFTGLLTPEDLADPAQKLRRQWEVLEVFMQWRYFTRRRLSTCQGRDDAWGVFVERFRKDPAEFRACVERCRIDFLASHKEGLKIAIHNGSIDADLPCAVRRVDACPICPPGAPKLDDDVESYFVEGRPMPRSLVTAIRSLEFLSRRDDRDSAVGTVVTPAINVQKDFRQPFPEKLQSSIRQVNVLREGVESLRDRMVALERESDKAPSQQLRLEAEVAALRERVDWLERARERDESELASLKVTVDALKRGIESSCHSLLSCIDVDARLGVKRSHSEGEDQSRHSQRRRDNAASAMRLDRIL
jgi:hypothetical protein